MLYFILLWVMAVLIMHFHVHCRSHFYRLNFQPMREPAFYPPMEEHGHSSWTEIKPFTFVQAWSLLSCCPPPPLPPPSTLPKSLKVNHKGRFTRHNFVACDKLTTSLRHESFRVNQTYNLLTIVAYDTKNVVGF